jgi:NitT/TauT family transport system substrate-binding protein
MMISRSRRRVVLASVTICIATLLNVSGSGAASTNVTKIDLGYLPVSSDGAVILGVSKGFFRAEGLDVTTHVAQSGAALIPAVVSGQYQFAHSNNLSLLLAVGKGLPVRAVHIVSSAGSDPAPSMGDLVVAKKSTITSPGQLAGKTIAVNGLNSTPHLATMVTLQNAGVDVSKVNFVQLNYPDMPLALEQGRVDAAEIDMPSLATAFSEGEKSIAHVYREIAQDLPISSWFTTPSYIDSHPDVVERFMRAVGKSNAYATAHPDELKKFMPTYMKIKPDLATKIALDNYPVGLPSLEILNKEASLAAHFGIVDKAPDASLLLTPAVQKMAKSLPGAP